MCATAPARVTMYISSSTTEKEIIEDESPRPVDIIEHIERVTDFSLMLKVVLDIIQDEHRKASESGEDCEVYVNISSGGSEYAAAAAIASMMVPGTIPFSVGTKEYTVDAEGIRKNYFIGDKPVGLTKSTYDPRQLPSYSIQIPEEPLVRGLRILNQRNESKLSVTSGKMIAALKEAGIWHRDTDTSDPNRKSTQRQTEAVYYQRDFIWKWQERGWIEKDSFGSKYVLTNEGRNIIATFYTGQ